MKTAGIVVTGIFGAAVLASSAYYNSEQKTGCIVDGDGPRVVNLETGRVTIRHGLTVDDDKNVCLYSEGSGYPDEIPIIPKP